MRRAIRYGLILILLLAVAAPLARVFLRSETFKYIKLRATGRSMTAARSA